MMLETGERFDLLDFFSWAKIMTDAVPGARFVVLDASLYWAVNAVPEPLSEKPLGKADGFRPAAEEVVEKIKKRISSGFGETVRKASAIRNRYLRAMASLFTNQPVRVIGGNDLWNGNGGYLQALSESIEFCSNPSPVVGTAPVSLTRTARYSRYNQEYQRWYTPLVLAEARYLRSAYGVEAKLGPTSETAFDKLIVESMRAGCIGAPVGGAVLYPRLPSEYQIFWYTRAAEGEVPYKQLVFFTDSNDTVRRKIKANPLLSGWLGEMAAPFFPNKKGTDSVDAVIALRDMIEEGAKGIG